MKIKSFNIHRAALVCYVLHLMFIGLKELNKELYNDLPKITETMRYHRLKFSGHIWRHDEETVHNLLFGCQEMEKTKEEDHRKHILTSSFKTQDYRWKNLKP